MKKILLILSAVVMLSACATTEVLNVWQEKGTEDLKFANVLVIGVIKEPGYRSLFEDSMVEQLNKLGTKASASYKLFPNVDYLDKSIISAKIKDLNMDGVIVVRLIDQKKETVHTPGSTSVSGSYYRGYPYATTYNRSNTWYGYYDNSYRMAYSPGYSVEYDVTTAEANVYDAKKEALVWSAMTETAETSVSKAITSYVKEVNKKLAASNLF